MDHELWAGPISSRVRVFALFAKKKRGLKICLPNGTGEIKQADFGRHLFARKALAAIA